MAWMLTTYRLKADNRRFAGTGGVSAENQGRGFIPGFLDQETGVVYHSRRADGTPASFHALEGLPEETTVLAGGVSGPIPVLMNGATYMADVMGGQIPFAFDAGGSLLPQARAGKVRLLGVAAAKRYPGMPDVPTLAEQGAPGVEAVVWMGMFAPAGTPAPVIARLNEAVLKSASTPEFAKKLEHAASDVWTGSPDDLRKFLTADIQKWTAVIQSAGIKIE